MDVGEWLRSLGLSRYEEAFREAEIGPDVLPDLTDSDLEKLGVPLGDRKRLLKAIASFGPAQMVAEPRGPSPTPSSTDAAERRQLTVMFCDLVGSTAMSARLDPEDMREVIAAYHRCCAELITKAGGFVAKYMGDGVLAYFGYPQAHEHDAERAVQAGLALVEATPKLNTAAGSPLHVRVGIATGLVVVGDLIGSGEAQERGSRRRDAEPGGAPASAGRTEHGRHRRGHAQASRRSVRARRPRGEGPQGHRRAGAGLGGAAREFRREPLRRPAHDRTDRPRRAGRGIRIAAAALVPGKDRRRPGGAASPARPASANRGSRPRSWNASPASRIRACAISARRSTPTARFIRSSARWNAPPDWPTTTNRKRSSTSSMLCSRRLRPRLRMPHSLPRCCRSRMTDAIPRWS